MERFITATDYTALIRDEIKDMLLQDEKYLELPEDRRGDYAMRKQMTAENMAIDQIKNYLFGRYDTGIIFQVYDPLPELDPRNAHVVMITIDCTLYHLYTSLAPNKIPQHRSDRYQDVINWLRDVARGNASADLPRKRDASGNEKFDFRITSEYPNEDNRW